MSLPSAELYALIMAALNRLQDDGGQFRSSVEKNQLSREEFWLLSRFRYFPGTVTPGDFQTFGPYTSISIYEKSLESLAVKKHAEKVDAGRYRSTEAGRKLVENLYRDYFNHIARHDEVPETELRRLGMLADRVLASALRQPDVPALITSAVRSTFPAIDQPWAYAERRIVTLAVFRDDAHIAAWREESWSGPRIAISTALFKTEDQLDATQLREAAKQLDDKDFKSAISTLHSGGELACSADDHYQLTPAGRTARQQVEALTDRNYALPFNTLDPIELKDFENLLERVRGPIAA
jgi:hypothetical protein